MSIIPSFFTNLNSISFSANFTLQCWANKEHNISDKRQKKSQTSVLTGSQKTSSNEYLAFPVSPSPKTKRKSKHQQNKKYDNLYGKHTYLPNTQKVQYTQYVSPLIDPITLFRNTN